jgi:hypothetical protein
LDAHPTGVRNFGCSSVLLDGLAQILMDVIIGNFSINRCLRK